MEDIASMHGIAASSSSSTAGTTTPENAAGQAPLQRALSLSRSNSSSSAAALRPHARSSASSAPASSPQTQARKRLSLSFPILPANSNLSPRHVSPVASPAYSPSAATSTDIAQLTPDDPMAFLTALAAQERRVLELKEELDRAETELGRLKRQWAVHEATKKLHDITPTSSERLRPLNTSIAAAGEDRGGGILSPGREQYQARKATLSSLNGTSTRKVLPSQRHQRTLSLLATNNTGRDRDSYRQPFPQPAGLDEAAAPPLVKRHTFASPASSTHSASSSVSSQSARPRPASLVEASAKRNSQDALLRTGKQMAEDFKEGLWTFIEDLRQATVGDEAISSATGTRASPMARTASKSSNRSSSPSTATAKHLNGMKEESLIDFGDSDNDVAIPSLLDGPSSTSSTTSSARWSTSSTVVSSDSHGVLSPPTSRSSTPRTSTSSTTSNATLWNQAAVATTLKKTASALITQVEKSLAPVPPAASGTGYYAQGKSGELRARGKSASGAPVKSKKA